MTQWFSFHITDSWCQEGHMAKNAHVLMFHLTGWHSHVLRLHDHKRCLFYSSAAYILIHKMCMSSTVHRDMQLPCKDDETGWWLCSASTDACRRLSTMPISRSVRVSDASTSSLASFSSLLSNDICNQQLLP